MKKTLSFLLLSTLLLILIGCRNDGNRETASSPVSLDISPRTATVETGTVVTLTVTARNTKIIWPETVAGSYTKNSDMAIWTLPSEAGIYEFTVAAAADADMTARAKVIVVSPPFPEPTITVSPAAATVDGGKELQFTAKTLIPDGQPTQKAIWSVTDDCGGIDEYGLFTASMFGVETCVVTATIIGNLGQRITAAAEITIAPADLVMALVPVEGGAFTMGCTAEQGNDCWYGEKPVHEVTVNDFYIGKYEVTQAQWEAVMGYNPSYFSQYPSLEPHYEACPDCPVESVNYYDVQEFIQKLNARTGKIYRLPTEAEWEYAARGGTQSRGYRYSGSSNIDEVAWYLGNSGRRTHPVGTKQANEIGLHDMSGNVAEFVQDWYGDYSADPKTNPTGPSSGSDRVFRGGGEDYVAGHVRVSYRIFGGPGTRDGSLGFRLASDSR
jgi:formylglycine-generating enzyme required for sulfatase activity